MGKWVDGESWLVTRGARVDTRCSMLVPGCWMLEKSFTAENTKGRIVYKYMHIYLWSTLYFGTKIAQREKVYQVIK